MYKTYYFLILLVCFKVVGQLKTYTYDQRISFVFKEKELGGMTLDFNSKDPSIPVIMRNYDAYNQAATDFVVFFFKHKGQLYKMNGIAIANYLICNGFTTYERERGSYSFRKADENLHTVEGQSNLKKYIAEVEKGVTVEMFTKETGGTVDYSIPTFYFMAEYFNLVPNLKIGEVMTHSYINAGGNTSMFNSSTVENIDITISVELEDFVSFVEERTSGLTQLENKKFKQPHFCVVTGSLAGTETRTQDLMDEFLGRMCDFYTVWGNHLDSQTFYKLYDYEAERIVKIYQKYQVLSVKQLEIFKKVLQEGRKSF